MKFNSISNFKFHITLILGLLIGVVVLLNFISIEYESQNTAFKNELISNHKEAKTRAKTAINSYATIVSSIRAYIKNSDGFPSNIEIQDYLNDILNEIDYSDSIVISLLNTDHEFLFVITPTSIDPQNLNGTNLNKYRPEQELDELSSLMEHKKLNLLSPINLVEGWAAFPFVFPVENKGNTIGYIAANVDVKYLLNAINNNNLSEKEFIHRVKINDSTLLSRDAVLNGSTIYNKRNDPPIYMQYGIDEDNFMESQLSIYGLQFYLGTAYIKEPTLNHKLSIITLIWYLSLSAIIIFVLIQYTRIQRLKREVSQTNEVIVSKNAVLKDQVKKIQTLIKEVHHRVKNNMQIISSLLNIQRNDIKNVNAIKALESSKMRIQSMALVHKKLYEVDNLDKINTTNYVKDLTVLIEESVGDGVQITKEFNIPDDHTLDTNKMIPIGLILNELITNSLKHAFVLNTSSPKVIITIKQTEKLLALTYSDNGTGLDNELDYKSEGVGLELVKILTQQLGGIITYSKQDLSSFSIVIEL